MNLLWSQPARRDLLDILHHYFDIDPELADMIAERIESAPLALLRNPRLGSPTPRKGVRKWRVRKTPLLVFYVANGERLEILRVLHAASDWRKA